MSTFAEIPSLPTHLLTVEQAEERLEPFAKLLDECIQQGWDAYIQHYAHRHHVLDARARAAIVFCEIVDLAKQKFTDLHDVMLLPKRNSFLLYIGNDIVIRFKKIGKNGRCSSINTRQQMLFQLQMELPGMETGTLLHAGYALDALQREIADKLVVCQFANQVIWTLRLSNPSGGTIQAMPAPQPALRSGPRWEVKPEAQKEAEGKRAKAMGKSAGKE